MQKKRVLILSLVVCLPLINAFSQSWSQEQIRVKTKSTLNTIMVADALFEDRWTELPQPKFWKRIMTLSPDTCLVNVAKNRMILAQMSIKTWHAKSEFEKEMYKQEIRKANGLDSNENIYITTGKSDFYRFHEVYPSLGKGIQAFENNQVDPWYAQAILLIESPAQLKKSVSGAYGPFQLMPSVAKKYGLIVSSTVDERERFDRSAYAASQLIKTSCIPSVKKIVGQYGLSYSENDLWFRLLVMHVYHAGAQNVAAVVSRINPEAGSKDLIQKMWVTSAASFGNNSQNYSQLVLAAQWMLHDYVYSRCDEVESCAKK
jgi:hypothetical protein